MSGSSSSIDSVLAAWSASTAFVGAKVKDSAVWLAGSGPSGGHYQPQSTQTDWSSVRESCPIPRGSSGFSNTVQVMSFGALVRSGSSFVRLAGLSGAAAVALGAYGAHSFTVEKAEYKRVYDTANFYHFIHTVVLLTTPLSRRPILTGSLFLSGMTIFCGTIYYHALSEEKSLRKFTPYGGMLLICGWLSLIL